MASFAVDFYSTIGIMVFAEFADKTNLLALSLMGKTRRPYSVAVGGLIGIAFVTLIGVIAGNIIGNLIPIDYIPIVAGLIFAWIGIAELREHNENKAYDDQKEETNQHLESDKSSLASTDMMSTLKSSALIVGIAEFGDKSQLFVIGRSVDGHLLAIFLGAIIGMAIIMFATAIFGERLIEKFPEETIHRIANYGFVIAGILLILTGLIGLMGS